MTDPTPDATRPGFTPDYVHKANETKLLAEARKADAESAELAARLRYVAVEAANIEMDWAKKQEIERDRLAGDDFHRIYRFTTDVNDKAVAACINTLTRWDRIDPGCEVTIIFTSPGGSVVDGLALFDFLMELREKGHSITGVTRGYAASMAGILLQACDKRVIGKESWVLIHEISGGMMGSFGELEDRLKWLEKVQSRILDIFAQRSGGKKTREEFEAAWHRTDFWLSSDEALAWGVVDEVA
jgi:ATP-dependent Clp endopeptidase proteolytic subunit ClpP